MATSPPPTGIRLTEQDRERLDRLAVFYGTDNFAALIRIALETADTALMAFREGAAQWEFHCGYQRGKFEEQYASRVRELQRQRAALLPANHPLVATAR